MIFSARLNRRALTFERFQLAAQLLASAFGGVFPIIAVVASGRVAGARMRASGAAAIILASLGDAVALVLAFPGGESWASGETQGGGDGGGECELADGVSDHGDNPQVMAVKEIGCWDRDSPATLDAYAAGSGLDAAIVKNSLTLAEPSFGFSRFLVAWGGITLTPAEPSFGFSGFLVARG